MIEQSTINSLEKTALQLRYSLLEMVGVGKAGHLGGSSSMAEIISVLYFHKMKINKSNPKDETRDRFLLSKGHAVLIQYAALGELGYFPKSEFKKVKTLGGALQGHPDMSTPGIEAVTGSLGQGLSIGVGLALSFRLNKMPNRVYVAMGDGELSEGQLWEAAMAAWKFKIDNLVGIVDCNKIQATGHCCEIFDIPDIMKKWDAFGWNVIEVDGHNIAELINAFVDAEKVKGKPTVIIAHTIKGKGFSFAENNAAYHNAILTEELFQQGKADLDKLAAKIGKN
jgi:transketolase